MVRLLKKKQQTVSFLTMFAITTFSLQISVLLLLMFQGINIQQLSLRKPPNFVQLIDGKAVYETDDLSREPEQIRQFINKTMTSIFNWSGTLVPQTLEEVTQPKPDIGILVKTPKGGSQKISTSTWIAGFGLSENFRKSFLSEIAEMTPPEVFSNDPRQAISVKLIIKRIYPPEKIASGKWRVGMVADIIQQKRADDRKIITPFNKDLLVRAIDYFPAPLSNNSSDLQKAIYSIRADKLEIYEIRNLCLLDADQSKQCANKNKSESFIK
jgi:hypothetical protein